MQSQTAEQPGPQSQPYTSARGGRLTRPDGWDQFVHDCREVGIATEDMVETSEPDAWPDGKIAEPSTPVAVCRTQAAAVVQGSEGQGVLSSPIRVGREVMKTATGDVKPLKEARVDWAEFASAVSRWVDLLRQAGSLAFPLHGDQDGAGTPFVGFLRSFNKRKGYGFVCVPDCASPPGKDFKICQSLVLSESPKWFLGQLLVFSVKNTPDKPKPEVSSVHWLREITVQSSIPHTPTADRCPFSPPTASDIASKPEVVPDLPVLKTFIHFHDPDLPPWLPPRHKSDPQ